MKLSILGRALLLLLASGPAVQAATATFDITTTWFEPQTRPKDTIFQGSFTWNSATRTVTNLRGVLSQSMTGRFPPPSGSTAPFFDQSLLELTHMVAAPAGARATQWHDSALGGTFATVFLRNSTNTFRGGDGWHPTTGAANSGLFHGFSTMPYRNSIQNAYALIFVPDQLSPSNPNITLTWNEAAQTGSLGLAHTAYADCTPGGMMGSVCMTAWSRRAYGTVGTMGGFPLSQVITMQAAAPTPTPTPVAVPVPVPAPAALMLFLVGIGLMGTTTQGRRHR